MDYLIKPFVGVGDYKLLSTEKTITQILDVNSVSYTREIWDDSECTVKVPWVIVRGDNGLHFFFAKDKLFKIFITGGYLGALNNGIKIGTAIENAKNLDNTLCYDEWNEDWSSREGYWLEDNLETKKVVSITIFIKELLDDDLFEQYTW